MTKKLSAEDYLQSFHNIHKHMGEGHDEHNEPEWYELAEAGTPMHGIAAQPFRRGGTVKPLVPAVSIPAMDDATKVVSKYGSPLPDAVLLARQLLFRGRPVNS